MIFRKYFYILALCCVVGVPASGLAQGSDSSSGESEQREDRGGRRSRWGDRGGERGGESRRFFGGRPGNPEDAAKTDSAAKPDAKGTSKPVARTWTGRSSARKTAASLTLPSQYSAKDVNRDGQIGMYEWSQSDLSTFKKLDVNGDGFLVPSEFANPGTRSVASTTIAPTTSAPSAISSSSGGTQTAGSKPAGFAPTSGSTSAVSAGASTAAAVSPTAESADPLVAQAVSAFQLRDLNMDGQLDQDEFDGSVRIKRVFEKAKLTFAAPMPRAKFLEVYREALLAKDAKPE